ncbi:hypothetical protein [Erythrobacter sp. R86502]
MTDRPKAIAQHAAMRFHTPHKWFTNGMANMGKDSNFQVMANLVATL